MCNAEVGDDVYEEDPTVKSIDICLCIYLLNIANCNNI